MKQSILIIDDDPILCKALVEKFTREGFVVAFKQQSQDGLEYALQNHPDVILLDIIMPVMDGLDVLRSLRKDTWGKEAKIIMLTNLSDEEHINTSFDYHVDGFLVKSNWKIEDVVTYVRKVLAA